MDDELASQFCVLYEKWYFHVCKRAYYFFGNEEVSRDVAQEVFYKVVVELEKGNRRVLDIRYLTRIATNLCIDRLRREGRQSPLLLDQALLETLGESDGVSRLKDSPLLCASWPSTGWWTAILSMRWSS